MAFSHPIASHIICCRAVESWFSWDQLSNRTVEISTILALLLHVKAVRRQRDELNPGQVVLLVPKEQIFYQEAQETRTPTLLFSTGSNLCRKPEKRVDTQLQSYWRTRILYCTSTIGIITIHGQSVHVIFLF